MGICPFEYRLFSARAGSRRRSSFVERRSIVDGLVFDAERLAFDPRCPNLLYLYSPATLHLFRCTYVMFLFVVVSFSPFSAPERGAGGGGRLLRSSPPSSVFWSSAFVAPFSPSIIHSSALSILSLTFRANLQVRNLFETRSHVPHTLLPSEPTCFEPSSDLSSLKPYFVA